MRTDASVARSRSAAIGIGPIQFKRPLPMAALVVWLVAGAVLTLGVFTLIVVTPLGVLFALAGLPAAWFLAIPITKRVMQYVSVDTPVGYYVWALPAAATSPRPDGEPTTHTLQPPRGAP